MYFLIEKGHVKVNLVDPPLSGCCARRHGSIWSPSSPQRTSCACHELHIHSSWRLPVHDSGTNPTHFKKAMVQLLHVPSVYNLFTLLHAHICMCTDKHQCTLAYIHVILLKYWYTHTLRQLLGVGKVQEAHVAHVRTFPKPNNCYRVRAYQYFNWFAVY